MRYSSARVSVRSASKRRVIIKRRGTVSCILPWGGRKKKKRSNLKSSPFRVEYERRESVSSVVVREESGRVRKTRRDATTKRGGGGSEKRNESKHERAPSSLRRIVHHTRVTLEKLSSNPSIHPIPRYYNSNRAHCPRASNLDAHCELLIERDSRIVASIKRAGIGLKSAKNKFIRK